jgi:cytidylate kinase
MASTPVITIDGPSGSGKGTIAAMVSNELGWNLLDSGALYRIVAWAGQERGIDLEQGAMLSEMVNRLDITFAGHLVRVDGVDVTNLIREERTTEGSSRVARLPQVREALREIQLSMRQTPGLIADGRDMGTVVFPDAELKIFLEANAEERARRRYKQLKDKGLSVNLRGLFESIQTRDERDRNRRVSPLKQSPDAILIDTTDMSIGAVAAEVMGHVAERRLASRGN